MMSLNKVIWTEGTLLSQQHFQMQDAYFESLYQYSQHRHEAYQWGFSSLVIDKNALFNKKLIIKQLVVHFNLGPVVVYCQSDDADLIYNLSDIESDKFSIYLCLPNNSNANGISAYPETTEPCRWIMQYTEVKDEYDKGRLREVLLGRNNIFLLEQSAAVKQCWQLKIAVIERNEVGELIFQPGFVPPTLTMHLNDDAELNLLRLKHVIQKKISRFKNLIKKGNKVPTGLASKTEYSTILCELVRSLSELDLLSSERGSHPYKIYKNIYGLIRIAESVTKNTDELNIILYDHTDLLGVFQTLGQVLEQVLDAVLGKEVGIIQLEKTAEGIFYAENIDRILLKRNDFYLAIKMQQADLPLLQAFKTQVKVGSLENILDLVSNALAGVVIEYEMQLDTASNVTEAQHYKIIKNGKIWQAIEDHGSIGIYMPKPFSNFEIYLVTS